MSYESIIDARYDLQNYNFYVYLTDTFNKISYVTTMKDVNVSKIAKRWLDDYCFKYCSNLLLVKC